MIRQLRLRMAAANIVLTGIVLAVLTVVMAGLSEAMYRQACKNAFQNDVSAYASFLRAADAVDGEWLARMETEKRYVIHVISGEAFHFSGAWAPPTRREQLLETAGEHLTGQEQRRFDGTGWMETSFSGGHGDEYDCIRASFERQGSETTVTVIRDRTPENSVIASRRWLYAGISAVVLAALCLISWWYAGRAVRPAVESLQKQKEFIAAASHELRTPLSVIRASVSALQVKPERAARLTANIDGECGRMARLVDDMLLLAGMDAQTWPVKLEPVELDTVLIGSVEKFRELAKAKGFDLLLNLPDELIPPVKAGGERLEQVLAILINNAVDYAGEGGEIAVTAASAPHEVRIDVADHGAGIPAAEREKVFGRFYRRDKARTEKAHFGLGLPIARELVKAQGGALTLLETPGGGCTFRISLRV